MNIRCYLKIAHTGITMGQPRFKIGITKTKHLTALSEGTGVYGKHYPTILIPLDIEVDEELFVKEAQNIKVVPQYVTRIEPVEEESGGEE